MVPSLQAIVDFPSQQTPNLEKTEIKSTEVYYTPRKGNKSRYIELAEVVTIAKAELRTCELRLLSREMGLRFPHEKGLDSAMA